MVPPAQWIDNNSLQKPTNYPLRVYVTVISVIQVTNIYKLEIWQLGMRR